jgi:WD40 repeat protein
MAQRAAPRVFISYAHQDGASLAGRLHQDLKASGWEVWLDTFRLTGGASWTAEIESALDSSEIVIALLSRGSHLSDTCRAEQLRSLRKNKCVIPILVEPDADRPIHLESKQYLDFSAQADYGTQFSALLACIRSRTGATLNSRFLHTYITVPPLPPNYVERSAELHALRSAVLRDGASRRVALTALKGMAGIGKTVLAQALCLDEVIQAAFPDGIIWVPVGKDRRDLVPLLREVGKAIGDSLDGYDSLQSASNRLRNRLSEKAVLIVLDDIWDPHDAAPFLLDSPRSRLLITTRSARTAIALGAQQQELPVLTWAQSLQLIAMWADVDIAKLPVQAADIVRECGSLPLAIAMVGAQLRGKPERWSHVLQKLRNADLDRIRQSFPEYPHPDLLRAIEVSMDALPTDLRQRYLDFAVFPEDCAIPEAAVGTLWNLDEYDVADSVDQLVDLSLATRDADRRLRIHDLVLDYLRHALGADKLTGKHRDLLASYGRKCDNDWPRGPNDRYFFENLIWHLRSARLADDALRLLMDFAWMQAKLDACGITPLVADYDWFAQQNQEARLIQEALRLSSYVLAMDHTQLAGQLQGRLPSGASAAIDSVRSVAGQFCRAAWLRPLRHLLTPPGGPLMFTLANHSARVRSLALSPDGARAVSASDDHTLKVWDLERGTLERTLTGHSDVVRAVALLPDGERAVSASDDHSLRVWDLSSGREEASIDTQLDWIRGLVVLPRTSLVASISDDRTIRIWDLFQGKVVRTLRGHTAEVNSIARMPDGESLVTAGDDRTVRIWAPSGGSEILKGHTARITALAVSGGGSIVSISADGAARLWTGAPGWQSQLLSWQPQGVRGLTFSPDKNTLLAAADNSNVHIWDLSDQRERVLEGHSDWVNCVAVSADGRNAISGSDDGTIKLWDLTRLSAEPPVRDHLERVRAVSVTSDGLTAISTSDDRTLRIWDLETRSAKRVLPNQQHWVFACIPGGRRLVSSGGSGSVTLWDLDSGQELQRFVGHQDRVRTLAVTSCGTRVISGGDDRTIRVWDVHSAKEILQISLARQWPRSIAITSDARFAITAAESSTVKVWSLASGEEILSLRGHTARVNAVAVLGSHRAVSGSDDHTVRVWNLETGLQEHVLTGHQGKVNAVAVLPGGKLVASASEGCDVRVWDAGAGVLIATYTVESPILACAASPRAPLIVAGDRSGLVHFLSLERCSGSVTSHS